MEGTQVRDLWEGILGTFVLGTRRSLRCRPFHLQVLHPAAGGGVSLTTGSPRCLGCAIKSRFQTFEGPTIPRGRPEAHGPQPRPTPVNVSWDSDPFYVRPTRRTHYRTIRPPVTCAVFSQRRTPSFAKKDFRTVRTPGTLGVHS